MSKIDDNDGENGDQENPAISEDELPEDVDHLEEADLHEYWRRNVRLITGLFVVWFAVSFLAAILLAEPLSDIQIGELPLAFWFAQQGSIMVFVILIFVYVWRMNSLDREYGVED